MTTESTNDVPSTEKAALEAIEKCFALIANGSHRIDRMDEVNACLSFLDNLHSQLKAKEEASANE